MPKEAAIDAHDAGCSRKDKGVVSVMVQGGGGISRQARAGATNLLLVVLLYWRV